MKKKLFLETCFFLGIMYALQAIYSIFFPFTPPEMIASLQSYKDKGKDIVYFGNSTTFYTSKFDTKKKTTPELLQQALHNELTVGAAINAAWNPALYLGYSTYVKHIGYYPKYIIAPINLHNFSISQDYYPTYQFVDETVYLAYYNTPFSPFLSFIDNFTTADVNQTYDKLYKDSFVYNGKTPIQKASFYETMPDTLPYKTRFKNIVEFYYMGELSPTHRKLLDLKRLANLYKKSHTKIIFYVTPLDYQTAENYFPGQFKKQIQENVKTITSVLHGTDTTVLDFSLLLPSSYFIWPEDTGHKYIDEHINTRAKEILAGKLAQFITKDSKGKK